MKIYINLLNLEHILMTLAMVPQSPKLFYKSLNCLVRLVKYSFQLQGAHAQHMSPLAILSHSPGHPEELNIFLQNCVPKRLYPATGLIIKKYERRPERAAKRIEARTGPTHKLLPETVFRTGKLWQEICEEEF